MTKNVYLIRHAEKDSQGVLTDTGRAEAKKLSKTLPNFSIVISSDNPRTKETATILTGKDPQVDTRAGFYMAPQAKSDTINKLSKDKGISFLEAAVEYNDKEVNGGIEAKAKDLNILIEKTLERLTDNESALIVSHDLCISPAMRQRGTPLESVPFLSGYIIDEKLNIKTFNK